MMEECSNLFKSKKNKQHTGLVPHPTGAYPFFFFKHEKTEILTS